MFGFILIFAYLFTFSGGLAVLFDTVIERTICSTIFISVLILYVFSIFDQLTIGLWICFLVGLAIILWAMFKINRGKIGLCASLFTNGFIVFTLFFIFSWLLNSGRLITNWDEFSHWGLVSKNIYFSNQLGSFPNSTTLFKGYPPATALFQYFWSKLYGSFAEGNLFRALNIFNFSLMVPIFSYTKKHFSFWQLILRFVFMLLLPLIFFNNYYSSIYVDATLGILFAYILLTYFANRKLSKIDKFNLLLSTSTLVLVKASGLGLALIAFLIILADQLINFRNKNWRYLLLLILTFVGFNRSWSLFLEISHADEAWNTSRVSVLKLIEVLSGRGMPYQIQTVKNFTHACFHKELANGMFNMTPFYWYVLSMIIGIFMIWLIKDQVSLSRFKTGLIGVEIGSLVYLFSLLVLYIFTYSEYEALKLASMSRYLSTYIFGIYIFLGFFIIIILDGLPESRNGKQRIDYLVLAITFLLLFSNSTGLENTFILNRETVDESITKRRPYYPVSRANQKIGANKKIYFISQNTSGQDYWIARYVFTPNHINPNFSWSIGKPYSESDIWTKDMSLGDWRKDLEKNYDYVYVYHVDDQFIEKYQNLFKTDQITNNTLYKIVPSKRSTDILQQTSF